MIQTLKLSSLEENIVYQCFLVVPFWEVTFLARESCVIWNASASRCLLSFEAAKNYCNYLCKLSFKVSTDLSMHFWRSKELGE